MRTLCIFALFTACLALTPSSYLTTLDLARFKSVFESALTSKDVQNIHYSLAGYFLLGETPANPEEICNSLKADTSSIASMYHVSTAAKLLKACKVKIDVGKTLLTNAIKPESPVLDIFHAFYALKNSGIPFDESAVLAALTESLKKDDSPASHGYAFIMATELSADVSKFYDSIEDIIAQADEVDEKYLQFEGGLYVTSLVVDGAYKLAEKVSKAPAISEDKVIKLTNYFLSRKHVHQLKSACHLLCVIKTLTVNSFHVPIAITRASSVAVSPVSPQVQVRVTNLMGAAIGKLGVTAESARHISDDAVVLSKKPFSPTSDKALYELNFLQNKPTRGFYKIIVSAAPTKPDKRFIGITGAEVQVKVTTHVSLENIEIGVADKDQTTATRTTKLQYPNKAANPLVADYHQKILMKFQLKDKSNGQLMTAHQAFVRLTNLKTKQEIIFVTEADNSMTNKFDLDVGSGAKDFGSLSGRYSMELIIGDAVIENPFSWYLADTVLTFPEATAPSKPAVNQYSPKPTINHEFKRPEKRPPKLVSFIFTALVVLPIFILFILWGKIGVNISNFPMSVSAIGFHVCLASIFGCYSLYWKSLNMFQTLKYVGLLSIPTFLFGNRLLSNIAAQRKK
ncbi:dolichyl-diphosphooligosaccharide--protein glycosyltransferase subunit 2 [Octopus sinensis]|uniref:Dolichyl-diphosphooligosaccharide--protein glycosyltransferase subunit 2 n=1 Tax=Octopus sinensis TaxID=2607531 RepID=A0A6P7SDZ9_9MOLL|nr:dolichyl-diphosphooligosaccharide--protein glycosyltransferase subunit 2 [Octopus sinensis]